MNIAMLLDNPFTNDRRVHREAKALVNAGHQIELFAMKAPGLAATEIVDGIQVKRTLDETLDDIKARAPMRRAAAQIAAGDYDVVHCHDQTMLHLGAQIKKLRPDLTLIYDSHELFHLWPLNLSHSGQKLLWLKSHLVRRFQIRRERNNRKAIDYLITVNDSLARILGSYLQTKGAPVVLRNVPERIATPERSDVIRRHFDIAQGDTILVFIGANIYRHTLNLESVIDQVGGVAGVALVFICGEGGNKGELRDYCAAKGYSNIHFHGLIAPADIPRTLASCDVGLVPTWNKKNLSYWYALDNKLFEYLMSEIPILATQQPEYRAIVEEFGLGICIDPEEQGAYLDGLRQIMRNYPSYADNLKKAKEVLNWEDEEQKLIALYQAIERERNAR